MKSDLNRSVSGYLGLLVGTFYVILALSWAIWPTNSRSSGIDWLNHSPIPVSNLSANHIMIWWAVGGIITVAGSVLTFTHKSSGIMIFASILTPMVVASLFTAAYFGGHSPSGIVSAISYALYGLLIPLIVIVEKTIFKREQEYIEEFKRGRYL